MANGVGTAGDRSVPCRPVSTATLPVEVTRMSNTTRFACERQHLINDDCWFDVAAHTGGLTWPGAYHGSVSDSSTSEAFVRAPDGSILARAATRPDDGKATSPIYGSLFEMSNIEADVGPP